jgi:hypothetical protein
LAKNGSFGFAKGRLVCRAKPNVPFVRLAKIVFKKCAVGKNKNTEALAFGSAVCWFICLVTLCLFLSFILAVSSFRLAGNVLGIAEGGEIKAESFDFAPRRAKTNFYELIYK